MDKYDLLEAMGGIRDEYIEEAAGTVSGSAPAFESASEASKSASASGFAASSHEHNMQKTETGEDGEKESHKKAAASRRRRIFHLERLAAGLAAVLCLSILVPNMSSGAASAFQRLPLVGNYFRAVTFRTYQYADSTSDAYVEEPGVITMSSGDIKVEDGEDSGKFTAGETFAAGDSAPAERSAMTAGAGDAKNASDSFSEGDEAAFSEKGEASFSEEGEASYSAGGENETADQASFDAGDGAGGAAAADPAAVEAALSAAQITEEIRQMASDQISGFEASLAEETGYRSLRFLHETVTDTDKWFCMEVYAYSSAADGFEQVTHFTIDKVTGERVTLESFFGEETDYMAPISDYIKTQMRAQMQADPDVEYWIDSKEEPEYDFTQILPDQDFYFNADGNLVICFNEGEAAPMYMGTVEFTLPQELVDGIRP